jgi:hypothetical protein
VSNTPKYAYKKVYFLQLNLYKEKKNSISNDPKKGTGIDVEYKIRVLALGLEHISSTVRQLIGCYLVIREAIYFQPFVAVTPGTENVLTSFCTATV